MRALQLRKNYFSISETGNDYLRSTNEQFEYEYTGSGGYSESLLTKYKSGDFLTYLNKTLGRTRSDTPDAFVVLGERTLDTSYGPYPKEYKIGNTSEQCLIDADNRGYATVNEFGRWLSVVSPTTADESMRKDVTGENDWGLNMITERNGEKHELYARKSNEMFFDINDQLIQERCDSNCNIEIKIVFKDDHVMNLQARHASGSSQTLTTQGDGKTRTATFPISGNFSNGLNNADFSVKTLDGSNLSVLMARINFLGNSNEDIYEDAEDNLTNGWGLFTYEGSDSIGIGKYLL